MPELPEVEVLRRDLDKETSGKKIKSVEVFDERSIKRNANVKAFVNALEGKKITSVSRTGKWLDLALDKTDHLVIHLGMSGQLLKATPKSEDPDHLKVRLSFTQGGALLFIDPRIFGEMAVLSGEEFAATEDIQDLGLDALDQQISWAEFGRMLMSRRTKLKSLLMDQKFIAGLGNIYSDEVLFNAGLMHDRVSNSLSAQEVRRLYRAVIEVLQEAVKYRGSTLSDGGYVDLFGKPGDYRQYHKVYDREGEACRRCRRPVVKAKISGRSTYYCEACQV
ncbi:MAG: bifunctional DNA-formamidopyrimidine glycosylase/DNA-(apurinic or apyrimidinic site) lyase [Actinobacteria bacterium]|nr:bifunctional DNA-formamidopyrimidine glycosylase/DNA-(apurinic or apyrimidinic site) lyase [Actinomycetota bacterium]MCB9388093.1 bifunctional DNA-formamidopyrimidine glycosylase/DNA-(apurinic or apyrimidinic site) lyase [Acidimicrobiia bacterium]